jgi:hypothetical protein
LLGVLATVLLAVGLVFPYIELWKNKGRVVGISFRFLAIDFAGALFSLLALVVQNTFDRLGGASYITVMILEIGIVLCHLTWLWRTRSLRKEAKDAGKDYDEYVTSMDAGPDTVRRSFVRIQDVPSDWPKTARVSAILSALRSSSEDEEKAIATGETAMTENERSWPRTVRVSTIVAAIHKGYSESTTSSQDFEVRHVDDERGTEKEPTFAKITPSAPIAQSRSTGGEEARRATFSTVTQAHNNEKVDAVRSDI